MTAIAEKKRYLAIIPARGGSKGIPEKNLRMLAGKPLMVWSIEQALACSAIDRVVVSTDSVKIARIARDAGAEVPVMRPDELALDTSPTEPCLLHMVDWLQENENYHADAVILLQPTSPLRFDGSLDRMVDHFEKSGADSLFGAVDTHSVFWRVPDGLDGQPVAEYDYVARPRRQDMPEKTRSFRENGSLYMTRTQTLREFNNRLGGRMTLFLMREEEGYEIDSQLDFNIMESLFAHFHPSAKLPERISLVVFDFDGVMTDNAVWVDQNGQESVRCSRADGLGLDALRSANIPAFVLSTEKNPVVAARCKKLQLACHHGESDKAAWLDDYLTLQKIDPQEVVYLGNDLNDMGCFKLVGTPVAVADAHPDIARSARMVLNARGGEGAVRELCDMVVQQISGESKA